MCFLSLLSLPPTFSRSLARSLARNISVSLPGAYDECGSERSMQARDVFPYFLASSLDAR